MRALKLRASLKERNRVQTASYLYPSLVNTSIYRRGRGGRPPRVQHKHAVLSIVLHFYTAPVEHKTLQELFGVASTTLSRLLRRGEGALSRALQCMSAAWINWPSKATQLYWASKSQEREPLVSGVFGFVDGKNRRVQELSCADLQNAHYNGMTRECN
ncbi:hypothetical protein H257_12816 [Aphanomyces astaci]|uniref:DDE Tnp4 domain-containing protein n=1 Tax=Aphanomyces astaci TaxID=112090 RepID=W4FYZ7_APHAT|nr:hypothetical protein H257_12816 [Aphanomyces astaci]ETV72009.1 hypothetical protein H257_12816 [Aphanomyces astaci]|eukprot:XP_009838452.1 hypothetical protein H257_12816 [Aphanomyces astaci]